MVKIVCISDTHLATPELPSGDYLIHAGDLTYRGTLQEISQQLLWLSKQVPKYKKVIIIPGNHDFGFEKNFGIYLTICNQYGIVLLNDSEFIHEGIKFYGSPITPFFHNWAFNKFRGDDIKLYWDIIPTDTDVLITHGAPFGILDEVPKNYGIEHVGCEDLLERIKELPKLKANIFGHLHFNGGKVLIKDNIQFVNASIMTEEYNPLNKPVIIEI